MSQSQLAEVTVWLMLVGIVFFKRQILVQLIIWRSAPALPGYWYSGGGSDPCWRWRAGGKPYKRDWRGINGRKRWDGLRSVQCQSGGRCTGSLQSFTCLCVWQWLPCWHQHHHPLPQHHQLLHPACGQVEEDPCFLVTSIQSPTCTRGYAGVLCVWIDVWKIEASSLTF